MANVTLVTGILAVLRLSLLVHTINYWSRRMTIKKSALASRLLPLIFVSSVGISQSALAAPCSDQIEALKTALNNGICTYSNVCGGLTHKLDNANHKLEQGKFDHAARRLTDFGAVLETMATHGKPKISMADYESLMSTYFSEAANCIANGGVIPDAYPDDAF